MKPACVNGAEGMPDSGRARINARLAPCPLRCLGHAMAHGLRRFGVVSTFRAGRGVFKGMAVLRYHSGIAIKKKDYS